MKFFISLILLFIFNLQISAQHQWKRTNPGGGGAIAMVGATANGTIVTASDLSGIYVSSNNGASWKVYGSTQGLTKTHISSLGFHPTDGKTFILGTSIGVFKATNGGQIITKSQLELHPNFGEGYIESIGMAISDASIGYLAHYEDWLPKLSFMKTTDAGNSWKIVNTTGIPVKARVIKILVDQNNADIVYALTGKARFGCSAPNLYKSTNGGKKWKRIGMLVNESYAPILDFDLHPTNPNTVYISTFNMAPNGCSLEMWKYAESSGKFYKSTGGLFQKISDHSGIISIGKDPKNISLVDIISTYGDTPEAGTWETSNEGSTWQHKGLVKNWNISCAHPNYAYVYSYNALAKTVTKDRFKPDRLDSMELLVNGVGAL